MSHVYLDSTQIERLELAARRVVLRLLTPERFFSPYGGDLVPNLQPEYFRHAVAKIVFPTRIKSSTRWTLLDLDFGVRAFRPDIIHVENEISSFILLQSLWIRRMFRPKARLIAFLWQNQPLTGGLAPLLNALSAPALSSVDYFLVGNSAGRNILLENGVPSERIEVLPAVGIDAERLRPPSAEERAGARRELGVCADELLVGYVGRFVPEKGLLDAVEAVGLLDDSLRAPCLRFMCIGNGPLKSALRQIAPKTIVWTPGGGEEQRNYYVALDALILPSRTTPAWSEQFGRVLIEAMACGVPVIGSSSGAIPEVIGDAGIVYPEGDIGALSAAMRRVALDGDLRATLARRGRRRVEELYTNQVISHRMVEMYDRVRRLPLRASNGTNVGATVH